MPFRDLTGQKFGRLTVIERVPNTRKGGAAYWRCKCECGNEKIVRGDGLTSGAVKSCGCLTCPSLIGQKFGRLTVIERVENNSKCQAQWKCQCDCGAEVIVTTDRLKNGNTRSCGCLHDEMIIARSTKHGLRHTKIYRIWCGIIQRCNNPNNPSYPNYGGRGIKVCDEWENDFLAFYNYVSKLPHYGEDGYTIDRIDNNGNYEPGNVRWANNATQSRNKRNTHIVEYNGEKMPLTDAAEKSGLSKSLLLYRINHGFTEDKLFEPVK